MRWYFYPNFINGDFFHSAYVFPSRKKKYIMSYIMSAYRQLIFLPASVSYIRLPSWYLLLEVPKDLTPSLPGFPIKGNGTHLSSHPWHILFPNSPLIYLIHHLFPLCFCMFLHFIFPIHLVFPRIVFLSSQFQTVLLIVIVSTSTPADLCTSAKMIFFNS